VICERCGMPIRAVVLCVTYGDDLDAEVDDER